MVWANGWWILASESGVNSSFQSCEGWIPASKLQALKWRRRERKMRRRKKAEKMWLENVAWKGIEKGMKSDWILREKRGQRSDLQRSQVTEICLTPQGSKTRGKSDLNWLRLEYQGAEYWTFVGLERVEKLDSLAMQSEAFLKKGWGAENERENHLETDF